MLLERESLLTSLRELVDEAVGSQGHLVLLGGEAGVGKTSLVGALARELAADQRGLAVRRGGCDDLTTPAALGPVLDALPEVAALAEGADAVDRLPLFRAVRRVLTTAPTVLVLEDVHWADEATLDLLRFLGRRLDGAPLLVVATYRSEAVGPGHPLAMALGDLATTPAVRRIAVPALSQDAVRALAESSGSRLDAGELFETTGGNAFYVTEVLASGDARLPPTVRDAVLARVARLSDDARHVLAAAAVLARPAGLTLLEQVSGRPPTAVDACVTSGLLVGQAGAWDFRHALARLAVAETLLPSVRADLHAAAYRVLTQSGETDDRRLAFHAAGCGDRGAVLRHAPRAAARASRLGAHREAAELYRQCLATGPEDTAQRHDLCSRLSYECYLTGELDEAHATRREALELADDALDRGVAQRWLSRLSWFLGRNEEADRWADEAVRTLEVRGDGPELAMAYSNKAQLAMLAFDVDGAQDWGSRAIEMARRVGDREVEIHALNNVGAATALVGDYLEGAARLQQSLDLALAEDAHEHVARAYTNLSAGAVSVRRFADADRHLRAGLAYCIERDLDSWQNYMDAWRSRSLAEQGHYDEAADVAARLLGRPHVPVVARIPALAVAAQVAVRRGEDAEDLLAEVSGLAEGTHEAQRLVPAAVARAEAAWLHGSTEEVVAAVDLAWGAAIEHPQEWELGELAWWLCVADAPRHTPVPVAAPYASMIDGAWADAAAAWADIGCPLWQALSLARLPDLEAARQSLALLDELDVPAVRAAVVRDRLAAGLPVPRGPRESSRSNAAGLTARELDVLALLVDGLSNSAIAEALVLSPKTVGHHVSSVLAKLGEPSRSRAAAAAVRRGIVPAASSSES